MRLALSSPFLFTLVTMIQSTRYRMENCQDKKDNNNNDKCKIALRPSWPTQQRLWWHKSESTCSINLMKILQQRQETKKMVTALTISTGRCGSSCLVEVVRICWLVTKVQHNNLPEEEVLEKIEKWKSKSEMMWFYSKILPTSINSWLYHQQPSPQLSST